MVDRDKRKTKQSMCLSSEMPPKTSVQGRLVLMDELRRMRSVDVRGGTGERTCLPSVKPNANSFGMRMSRQCSSM
jgi:hypothetical protein